MGQELYELCPGEKDFLWVEGARHVKSMHRAPAEYEAKLDTFIEKYNMWIKTTRKTRGLIRP